MRKLVILRTSNDTKDPLTFYRKEGGLRVEGIGVGGKPTHPPPPYLAFPAPVHISWPLKLRSFSTGRYWALLCNSLISFASHPFRGPSFRRYHSPLPVLTSLCLSAPWSWMVLYKIDCGLSLCLFFAFGGRRVWCRVIQIPCPCLHGSHFFSFTFSPF